MTVQEFHDYVRKGLADMEPQILSLVPQIASADSPDFVAGQPTPDELRDFRITLLEFVGLLTWWEQTTRNLLGQAAIAKKKNGGIVFNLSAGPHERRVVRDGDGNIEKIIG